jgi:hypothetical protein
MMHTGKCINGPLDGKLISSPFPTKKVLVQPKVKPGYQLAGVSPEPAPMTEYQYHYVFEKLTEGLELDVKSAKGYWRPISLSPPWVLDLVREQIRPCVGGVYGDLKNVPSCPDENDYAAWEAEGYVRLNTWGKPLWYMPDVLPVDITNAMPLQEQINWGHRVVYLWLCQYK